MEEKTSKALTKNRLNELKSLFKYCGKVEIGEACYNHDEDIIEDIKKASKELGGFSGDGEVFNVHVWNNGKDLGVFRSDTLALDNQYNLDILAALKGCHKSALYKANIYPSGDWVFRMEGRR